MLENNKNLVIKKNYIESYKILRNKTQWTNKNHIEHKTMHTKNTIFL